MRYISFLVLVILSNCAWADANRWHPVSREGGCHPFTWVYKDFPELTGKKTPAEFVKVLKITYPDTNIEPFIDVIAREHKERGSQPTSEEKDAYKAFTQNNAMVVSWDNNIKQLILFTEDLCGALYGKQIRKAQ